MAGTPALDAQRLEVAASAIGRRRRRRRRRRRAGRRRRPRASRGRRQPVAERSHAGPRTREPAHVSSVEVGLGAEHEPLQPGQHRLAAAGVDVEQRPRRRRSGCTRSQASTLPVGWRSSDQAESPTARRVDVLAELALEERRWPPGRATRTTSRSIGAAPEVVRRSMRRHGREATRGGGGSAAWARRRRGHAAGRGDGGEQGLGLVAALEVLVLGHAVDHDAGARPAPTPRPSSPRPACGWRWRCRCCPRSRGSRPRRRRGRAWWARGRR